MTGHPNLCGSWTTELGLMIGYRPELDVPDQDPPALGAPQPLSLSDHRVRCPTRTHLPLQAPQPLWFSDHRVRSLDRVTQKGARPGPNCPLVRSSQTTELCPNQGSHVCNRPRLELDEKCPNQPGGNTSQYINNT
ncbi:hypothetical protein TIFTF001_041937 [Ficus carica]|uniref:Uncharacterized protein n=1 Tax=Ficus carica TaxID=3494 RepID=A0AA88CSY7_FICCA|nr:hypothetical protein TIFTF001_041924 [Ficus carica]GMN33668.1 hypothetical protein TIFTF001_041927 [Ficus carica]GMN33686.1 hypothetical protein TIFTF001_041934 [Ficus carica]GMN33712.1 hypothetical protein TIFTF001_041937 [Ficus carica]